MRSTRQTRPSGVTERLSRGPQLVDLLGRTTGWSSLSALDAALGLRPGTARDDLRALAMAGDDGPPPVTLAFSRKVVRRTAGDTVEEFDEEIEPAKATHVRVAGGGVEDLGLVRLAGSQVLRLIDASEHLLLVEPQNEALRGALQRLLDALDLPMATNPGDAESHGNRSADPEVLSTVVRAQREGRLLHFLYEAEWNATYTERTVIPQSLVVTTRGWELDAYDTNARGPRTFVVSRMTDASVTDHADPAPQGIAVHRGTETVSLVIPKSSVWVVERVAESYAILADDEDLELRVDLLPPVAQRVAMIRALEPRAFPDCDHDLEVASNAVLDELIRHHGG